ncbi:hypothetical protein DVH24_021040 [Malus domestica]|uniref:Gnk2-homologous domain-containing protein n=1 Tax=Malus domestica TaxID=3750 RepID=A0A498JB62_MALDO|nr:hypothetical protein DVH24_021040 [Malus domestica]
MLKNSREYPSHRLLISIYAVDDHIILAMVSSRLIRLSSICMQILLLIINVNFTQAQLGPHEIPAAYCFNGKGNYTTGSIYQTNLNSLLSNLFDANNGYGFYNSSLGENNDRVYAIGLCRGDITKEACGTCLSDTANGLTKNCPKQREAIGWLPNCMLRYSNRSIYGIMETDPVYNAFNVYNVSTGFDAFNQELSRLFNGLGGKAATGGDLRKVASGNATIPSSNITIYGLAQCTPDLSEQSCIDCLEYASGGLGSCCNGSLGVRVVTPSCSLRYELFPFVGDTNETPPPSPPLATPPANTAIPGGKKSKISRTVIIMVVTVVVSLVLIMSICIYLRVKKMKEKLGGDEILNTEALQFDFGSIRTATNNFSEENKLGRGGFGAVYRVMNRITKHLNLLLLICSGYMAPEYVMRGHFSVKSDVYSFGVLVLEIITGQKNSSFCPGGNAEDLLSYAWKSWKEDTASNLIGPISKSGSIPEIMRCIHIGLLCVQPNIADRPTMATVILMLTSYSLDLPVPSQPAFYMDGGIQSSSDTSLGWKDNSSVTRLDLSKSNSVEYLLHG